MSTEYGADCAGCSHPTCIYRAQIEQRGPHKHRAARRTAIIFIVIYVFTMATGFAVAQVLSQVTERVDFLSDLWAKVQQGGVIGAMFAIYFMWRAERRLDKLQTERDGLLERVILGLSVSTQTIDNQNSVLDKMTDALTEATTVMTLARERDEVREHLKRGGH
jgi:hypothetical protein